MPKKVLVIGGTGMLGRPVVRRLKVDGFEVTVMSSHPDLAREKLGDSYTVIKGDVIDKESLKMAIDGQSMVHINLSAHLKPELYEWSATGQTCDRPQQRVGGRGDRVARCGSRAFWPQARQ